MNRTSKNPKKSIKKIEKKNARSDDIIAFTRVVTVEKPPDFDSQAEIECKELSTQMTNLYIAGPSFISQSQNNAESTSNTGFPSSRPGQLKKLMRILVDKLVKMDGNVNGSDSRERAESLFRGPHDNRKVSRKNRNVSASYCGTSITEATLLSVFPDCIGSYDQLLAIRPDWESSIVQSEKYLKGGNTSDHGKNKVLRLRRIQNLFIKCNIPYDMWSALCILDLPSDMHETADLIVSSVKIGVAWPTLCRHLITAQDAFTLAQRYLGDLFLLTPFSDEPCYRFLNRILRFFDTSPSHYKKLAKTRIYLLLDTYYPSASPPPANSSFSDYLHHFKTINGNLPAIQVDEP